MKLRHKHIHTNAAAGFTIMEIVVATAIFATTVASMMALFNYVLKINRRAEAMRQATQGMRNMVEFIAKEIRNGWIDYGVINGSSINSALGPCPVPTALGGNTYAPANSPAPTSPKTNRLGIVNIDGERECFYFGNGSGALPSSEYDNTFSRPNDGTVVFLKQGLSAQIINPSNFTVQEMAFFVRPRKDPYTPNGGYMEMQPSVTMVFKFRVALPTGEVQTIFYQTSISTDKYDVPKS